MALSLPGERSVVAATPTNPFAALARWVGKVQAARARHAALMSLLALDADRLDDLGVRRADVLAALECRDGRAGSSLNAARARNARRI